MNRLLVTGATGLLGSHVVLEALARGWQVRALVRRPDGAAVLAEAGAEIVRGDVLSAASLRRAMTHCDSVVHTAAAIGAGNDPALRAVNVVGTENVLDAAAWAAARVVHVSSTAVFGGARYHAVPTDEETPLPTLRAWDHYGRTKQAAERLALTASGEGRVWAAVVRPPVMYGERDRQFVPRVAPVLRRGWAPLPGGGTTTLPLVHAGSAARGILAALGYDRADGRIYHLTEDRPVTLRDVVEGAARGLGRPVRTLSVPRAAAGGFFALLAATLTCVGRVDLARHAPGTYRMLTRDNPFSTGRARAELGWRPRIEPREALEDAFRWWAAHRSGGRT